MSYFADDITHGGYHMVFVIVSIFKFNDTRFCWIHMTNTNIDNVLYCQHQLSEYSYQAAYADVQQPLQERLRMHPFGY